MHGKSCPYSRDPSRCSWKISRRGALTPITCRSRVRSVEEWGIKRNLLGSRVSESDSRAYSSHSTNKYVFYNEFYILKKFLIWTLVEFLSYTQHTRELISARGVCVCVGGGGGGGVVVELFFSKVLSVWGRRFLSCVVHVGNQEWAIYGTAL